MNEPKYSVGNKITYRDPYLGFLSGVIIAVCIRNIVNDIIYIVEMQNGSSSFCKEEEVNKVINF